MSERLTGDFHKALDKQWLGHWDCPAGGLDDLVVTIDHFAKSEVTGTNGSKDKKNICYFYECKPLICNVTNMKMIAKVLGSNNFEDWEGKQIALYEADERRAEDGKAIRVRPYKPKVEAVLCEGCGKPVTAHGSYSVNKIIELSKGKYGARLCWDCASKMKEEQEG